MGRLDAGPRPEYAVRAPELDPPVLQIAAHVPPQRRNRVGRFEGGRFADGHVPHRISSQVPVGQSRSDGRVRGTALEVRASAGCHVGEVRNVGRVHHTPRV